MYLKTFQEELIIPFHFLYLIILTNFQEKNSSSSFVFLFPLNSLPQKFKISSFYQPPFYYKKDPNRCLIKIFVTYNIRSEYSINIHLSLTPPVDIFSRPYGECSTHMLEPIQSGQDILPFIIVDGIL